MNCRYCFRRHFPYQDHKPKDHALALQAICSDNSISGVILSGGDQLVLGDKALASLLQQINAIPQVARIRLHSRLRIVLPQRVTQGLLALLQDRRCPVASVV